MDKLAGESRARMLEDPFLNRTMALAFTADGRQLVVAGEKEISVRNVANGKLEKRVRTEAIRARSMKPLRDGRLVVSGDYRIINEDFVTPFLSFYDLNGSAGNEEDGAVTLDGVNDKRVKVKQLFAKAPGFLPCFDVSADGKTLVAPDGVGRVLVADLGGG